MKNILLLGFMAFSSLFFFSCSSEEDEDGVAPCRDGVKNFGEYGVDCGGGCAPCPNGILQEEQFEAIIGSEQEPKLLLGTRDSLFRRYDTLITYETEADIGGSNFYDFTNNNDSTYSIFTTTDPTNAENLSDLSAITFITTIDSVFTLNQYSPLVKVVNSMGDSIYSISNDSKESEVTIRENPAEIVTSITMSAQFPLYGLNGTNFKSGTLVVEIDGSSIEYELVNASYSVTYNNSPAEITLSQSNFSNDVGCSEDNLNDISYISTVDLANSLEQLDVRKFDATSGDTSITILKRGIVHEKVYSECKKVLLGDIQSLTFTTSDTLADIISYTISNMKMNTDYDKYSQVDGFLYSRCECFDNYLDDEQDELDKIIRTDIDSEDKPTRSDIITIASNTSCSQDVLSCD